MRFIGWVLLVVGLLLLASCDGSLSTDAPAEAELPIKAMALAPNSETVNMSFGLSSQGSSARLPNLNNTDGKRVAFEYQFSNGEKINYIVQNGTVASGDMLLSDYDTLVNDIQEYEATLAASEGDLSAQAALAKPYCIKKFVFCLNYGGYKWPDGIVTYEMPPTTQFNSTEWKLIKSVMDEISANTKIRFKTGTSGDRIRFRSDKDGCSSWVGREGGVQVVSLSRADNCIQSAVIRHEIGHALGFIHEHQRFDRDNYVTINYNNIASGQKDNFQIFNHTLGIVSGYDFNSIMHYSGSTFRKAPGLYTMVKKSNGQPPSYIYNYSSTDLEYLRRYYP